MEALEAKLSNIIQNNKHWTYRGEVATYIPELTKAKSDCLGIYVIDTEGKESRAGDWDYPFTIQSISKVAMLICALMHNDLDQIFRKIDLKPTADSFNAIANLEVKNQSKPLNPMINSGAIVALSTVKGDTEEEKFNRVLHLTHRITRNPKISVDNAVYRSEKASGHQNRALGYLLKNMKLIDNDVEKLLDAYFKLCSLTVTCKDLAVMGSVLANEGAFPGKDSATESSEKRQIISREICKKTNAILSTCGMYEASVNFAVKVGIPAKSGVGGGILGSVPKKMGLGVVGPALDETGNSYGGVKVLEDLSKRFDLSIFV